MSGEVVSPRFAGWSMGYSHASVDTNTPNGISVNDPAEVILSYLLDEVDRQIASIAVSEEVVRAARLIEA